MSSFIPQSITRRRFLSSAAVGTAVAVSAPAIVTANKSGSRRLLGDGDYQFEFVHDWAKLPAKYKWQTTHNVAVDREGRVYVIHEGRENLKDHPSIFVFDQDGKFINAFGSQFQGGGHGIEVRSEGNEQFLYVAAYQQLKTFAKLTLDGKTIWQKYAPMESGVYAEGEDTKPEKKWGRDRFMPTNFAFLDDGGFFLADGYGAFYIHRYDKDGNWLSCFGGAGEGEGKFNTPHGLWIDRRVEGESTLIVCDRAHHTLQSFTLEGKYLGTKTGYGLPANIDTYQDLLVVPELHARVSLLDKELNVIARLGDDRERILGEGGGAIRNDASKWNEGRFVHPHDACFDLEGNLLVAEWVATGRVSQLRRV